MAEFQIKTLLLQPEKRPSMCKTPDTLFESPNTDLEPGKPGLTEWCPMVLDKSFCQMNTYKVQQSEYGASCYPEALTLSWRFGWSDTLPRHLSLVLIRHPSVLKRPEMLEEDDCCLLNQGKISAEPLKILKSQQSVFFVTEGLGDLFKLIFSIQTLPVEAEARQNKHNAGRSQNDALLFLFKTLCFHA